MFTQFKIGINIYYMEKIKKCQTHLRDIGGI